MKGGVAVQLAAAAALTQPARDVTWIFYDCEKWRPAGTGLRRISRERPGDLAGDFAVLCEPSNARVEGGCQGTMRIEVRLRGVAAHSARAWMGRNAVHDAAPVLQRLAEYQPAEIEVDGLLYREGLNAVRISGGTAGNIIPDSCQIEINYGSPRQVPGAGRGTDPTGAEGLPVGGHRCRRARPGRPDRPAAKEFVAAVGGEPSAKFGWTDVARFSAMGVPAVNLVPATRARPHADDEFCPAADVVACRNALVRWLT